MSLLGALSRQCRATIPISSHSNVRFFASSQSLQYKKARTQKATKRDKGKKKTGKTRVDIYNSEKLTLMDAISILRAVEVGRPNATFELFVKTQMKSGVAVPKGRVTLPRDAKPKSEDKILVFAEGRQAEEAKRAGAHVVGGPELIEAVLKNRHQATTILCTPALVRTITPKLGRFLGPLGLMPSERRGTVTDDIAGYIQRLHGTSEWRADKSGNIRTAIAKLNFPVEDVVKNIDHFMTSVKRVTGNLRDDDAKKAKSTKPVTQITKVILSSNQGPGIRIKNF